MKILNYSKTRRVTALFLSVLMCVGAFNSNLIGSIFSSTDASIVNAAGDDAVRYDANEVYYDSGSMWLQAYYSLAGEGANTSDNTYIKTNGKYVFDETHYHETDGWLTLDVTSNFTNADAVTLPATTNINDIDASVMSCWREYLGSKSDSANDADAIYGVNVADFGTPAASGQEFAYIACGKTVAEDVDNDGLDEIRIDWQIRAWPESLGDAPTSVDDIAEEWAAIDEDIASEKTSHDNTYESKFYNEYAPKWLSGNTWYNDWIESEDLGISIIHKNWEMVNGAHYYNSCTRVINYVDGISNNNIWTAIKEGDNLSYATDASGFPAGWLTIFVDNKYATENHDASNFVNFEDIDGSTMQVYMPTLTMNGTTYSIDGATIDDTGEQVWTLTADAFDKGTSDLNGVSFGVPTVDANVYANYLPDIAGVISTLWPMTRDEILTPAYTDANNGKAPTAYRLYGYGVDAWSATENTAMIVDNHSLDAYMYNFAYLNADTNTPDMFVNMGSDDSVIANSAKEVFAELSESAVTEMSVALIYDVTYDRQRAGGDISAYIEPITECSITTELTDAVSGKHYAEVSDNVTLHEKVTYTIGGTELLNKQYRVDATLYVTSYNVASTLYCLFKSSVPPIV